MKVVLRDDERIEVSDPRRELGSARSARCPNSGEAAEQQVVANLVFVPSVEEARFMWLACAGVTFAMMLLATSACRSTPRCCAAVHVVDGVVDDVRSVPPELMIAEGRDRTASCPTSCCESSIRLPMMNVRGNLSM